MKDKIYSVGIIGCGNIFARHLEAITDNKDYFKLVAITDIDKSKLTLRSKELNVPGFTDYKDMLLRMKNKMDFVVIATPNSFHYEQAIHSLRSGYNILVEKPICFEANLIEDIAILAKKNNLKAYAVLQVRYNPAIQTVKSLLEKNIVGDIRSVSLIQRWQRPESYFDSWRADPHVGGRTLYEVGIHYMDILQLLFGLPKVVSSSTFSNKHKSIPFEDTVFSILKFPSGASGSLEVTIASEPRNLECSMSIMGSRGYIKIGGKALDSIEIAEFSSPNLKSLWDKATTKMTGRIEPNSYGLYSGSCPNHPTLYKEIAKGRGLNLSESVNVVQFIEDVYRKELKDEN